MPFVAKRAISYSVWSWTVFFNDQVELSCPKEMAWKVNMHRGYLAICHPEEQQLNFIERLVEMASSLAIREWRRLPHIVSHVHTPLLQVSNTQWMKSTVFFFSCSENILPWFFFTIGEQKSSYFDRRWRRGLSQRWSSCFVEQLLITPSIFLYYVKFRWIVENIQKNLTKSFIPPVEIVTDWGEDKGREEEEKLKKAGGWAE